MIPRIVSLLGYLRINNLEWLTRLSSLENLEIESVDLSKANEWLQVINMLPSLVDLRLSNCSLHHITPLLDYHNFSSLKSLDLSENYNLGSSVPQWVFYLPNLVSLDLSYCYFIGPLPDGPVNLTSLTTFKASRNSFNCRLPKWLFDLNNLEHLDLSTSGIEEEIPDCWMNWPELKVLILRDNNLIGSLPRSMAILNLAENEFIGKLPSWLGMKFPTLIVLILRSNKFDGELPQELCHLKDLQILDLANNAFVGIIPRCIGNLSAMVKVKKKVLEDDFELNYSSRYGTLIESASWINDVQDDDPGYLYLHHNKMQANWHQYMECTSMRAGTKQQRLAGDLEKLNSLPGSTQLNLTDFFQYKAILNNDDTPIDLTLPEHPIPGQRIPNDIGDMKVLESVDLSKNQLYGQIPPSFSSLTTLSYLNLSNNNLSGMIPLSTQLQSFDPTSFLGNELCGLPLLVNCSLDGNIPNHKYEDDESDKYEVDWFYISMAIGFALSFWGVCGSLLFKRSWRHAYFRFLDRSWEMLLAKLPIC
ncbi:hypothetical protein KY284_003907 [Solanum tuberosum]|nr:hypothetical protein KY284_003907 [Solanum tuberosum]